MHTINKNQVTLDGSNLVTEASTAGLAPGEWPDFIAVVDDGGSGLLFGPATMPLEDGGRRYSHPNGTSLIVFND